MRVLGIAGLNRSMAYKQEILGGFPVRFHRICQGMDSAAALIEDGRVVAAVAEERLNRKKHSNLLPVESIRFCLEEAGCRFEDLDQIAFGFDFASFKNLYMLMPGGREWYSRVYSPDILCEDLEAAFGDAFSREKLTCVDHHLAHAASAYFPSGFDRAMVLVADGMGEMKAVSIYDAEDGKIRPVHSINYSSSVGILYSLITFHLGFDFNADEYKTMGLAPYGDPSVYLPVLESWVEFNEERGDYKLKFIQSEPDLESRETYARTLRFIAAQLFEARAPDAQVEQKHMDLAAALQVITNRITSFLARFWMEKLGHDRLCMAGGVALNCVANEKIRNLPQVKQMFVQPASADDGTALGAAMHVAARHHGIELLDQPYYGPGYDEAAAKRAFEAFPAGTCEKRTHGSHAAAAKRIAELIANGKVVALYQGRMEFGPRALGNRSILADPRDPQMRDRVNEAVKMREGFRPFAPVVMAEHMRDIFEPVDDSSYKYMLLTLPVRPEFRERLPAITHVDGSARLQTITSEQNSFYYEIVRAFRDLTDIPVLLNTSFNVKGQVIVHTPDEAVRTFRDTGIDSVFLDRHEITKVRTR